MGAPLTFTLAAAAAAIGVLAAPGCAGRAGGGAAPAAAGALDGAPAERRRFEVAGSGSGPGALSLDLGVPAGWSVVAAPVLGEGSPVVVRLEPPGGRAHGVLTAYEHAEPAEEAPPAEAARTFALMARRKALGAGAEERAPLERLEAPGVEGFWFVATGPAEAPAASPDAPPGARPYRNMLRGAAAVGRLFVTFTLLDDAPGPEREALLGVIRGAREVSGDAAAPPGGSSPGALRLEPDPWAETAPLSVAPPGRPFTVVVDLPGFAMFRPRPTDDGAGWLVLGQDAEAGLVASVTVSPAPAGAADARACRDAALERLRTSGAEPGGLAVADAGAGARASYALPEGSGAEGRHAHAFFARDGACVDVHVSVAEPEPDDAARVERILASVRFGERL